MFRLSPSPCFYHSRPHSEHSIRKWCLALVQCCPQWHTLVPTALESREPTTARCVGGVFRTLVTTWKEPVSEHTGGCPSPGCRLDLWAQLTQSVCNPPPFLGGSLLHLLSCLLIGPFSLSSIVLMASKGRYISRGPWTRVLEKLGADKGLKLKGKGFGPGFM